MYVVVKIMARNGRKSAICNSSFLCISVYKSETQGDKSRNVCPSPQNEERRLSESSLLLKKKTTSFSGDEWVLQL